jgi:hypothetical protein
MVMGLRAILALVTPLQTTWAITNTFKRTVLELVPVISVFRELVLEVGYSIPIPALLMALWDKEPTRSFVFPNTVL